MTKILDFDNMPSWPGSLLITVFNKKVLMRERKRHTARRVVKQVLAMLGEGGHLSQVRGVPHPRSGGGTPSQVWGGTPS